MGLILDTTVLVEHERLGKPIDEVILKAQQMGEPILGLAAGSVVELTHGIYRARNEELTTRRRIYVERAFNAVPIYSLTRDIAELAGRIEGEQASIGVVIPFQDLLIGVTALSLGCSVATASIRHYKLIPGLAIVPF